MSSQYLRAEGHVFQYRLGKWVRPLEDHPHPMPEVYGIDVGSVNILPVQENRTRNARVRDEIVHPVEGPEEGGLAAARRPDEGRNLFLFDLEVDILQGLKRSIKKIQALGLHLYLVTNIAHGR